MTKMQKLVLLMTFWFSPEGPDKIVRWGQFTDDKQFCEDNLFNIIAFVINGIDDKFVNWSCMQPFVEQMNKDSGIVVEQVGLTSPQDELPMDLPTKRKRPHKRLPPKKEQYNDA